MPPVLSTQRRMLSDDQKQYTQLTTNSARRGLLWMAAAGAVYGVLNAILRSMTQQMGPFQTLTLVYAGSLIAMAPVLLRRGAATLLPCQMRLVVARGLVHWVGLCMWLVALAHITLAEMTAITFTGPLFITAGGAALVLREPMRWERVAASVIGFAGVLVVLYPRLLGNEASSYALLMLGSSAVFSLSFLLAKRLTWTEQPAVIVAWQSLVVALCSFPFAALNWTPPALTGLAIAFGCGALTALGNYCFTRAFSAADISATQSVKFLDLIWATLFGWLLFDDRLQPTTWLGAVIILGATVWAARRAH